MVHVVLYVIVLPFTRRVCNRILEGKRRDSIAHCCCKQRRDSMGFGSPQVNVNMIIMLVKFKLLILNHWRGFFA
jgi:hypothetical protein